MQGNEGLLVSVRTMACVNHLLQILFFQKYRFAELLSSSPSHCGLQNLLRYIQQESFQIFANYERKENGVA